VGPTDLGTSGIKGWSERDNRGGSRVHLATAKQRKRKDPKIQEERLEKGRREGSRISMLSVGPYD